MELKLNGIITADTGWRKLRAQQYFIRGNLLSLIEPIVFNFFTTSRVAKRFNCIERHDC
jgi:hypothetical protein